MKRILLLIAILAGLGFMWSCEKAQENPVLDTTKLVPAELKSPIAGGNYVLLQINMDKLLFKVEWDAANYILPGIVAPRYTIELDVDGNNFAAPATIATVDTLVFELTVDRLNNAMNVLGLEPGKQAAVNMRIRSFIAGGAESLTKFSNVITFTVTPFKFKVRPIWLLGNGTDAGWNNRGAIEMEHVEAATYAKVTNLKTGSGVFFKFISVPGQWAPQWGTDANPVQIVDGVRIGNLSYRPTESIPDPPAIPVPPVAGSYRIVADTIGLKYRVEPVPTKLFVVGDAIGAPVEMISTAPGKFYTTIKLDGRENLTLQFSDGVSARATRFGSESRYGHYMSRLVEGENSKVVMPAKAGTFRVEVNLATQTYRIVAE